MVSDISKFTQCFQCWKQYSLSVSLHSPGAFRALLLLVHMKNSVLSRILCKSVKTLTEGVVIKSVDPVCSQIMKA